MNLLAIDIGNTHTVLGIFKRKKLVDEWRMESSARLTEARLWTHVSLFCAEAGVSSRNFDGIVIASVVPRLTELLTVMSKKRFGKNPLLISGNSDVGLNICYDDPTALGADRICSVVAAYRKYGAPAIVIDCGTATTYDIISKRGEYLGGVIAAGVETSAMSLFRRTARLPSIALQFPDHLIGTNTIACLQSGIMYGALDAVDGMIRRLRREIGGNAHVIATGGYAQLVGPRSRFIDHIDLDLVLEGARLIFERVNRR